MFFQLFSEYINKIIVNVNTSCWRVLTRVLTVSSLPFFPSFSRPFSLCISPLSRLASYLARLATATKWYVKASLYCRIKLLSKMELSSWLSLLLVLSLLREGFNSPGTPVFRLSSKPPFLNSNSIRNPRATGLSVLTLLSASPFKGGGLIRNQNEGIGYFEINLNLTRGRMSYWRGLSARLERSRNKRVLS